ncbi:MAG: tetratricopeptide repeat protein [Planctomycetota bacterium]|nr:tetratricopeptide repeat protein [Planctomycetota bacterium]
MKQAFRLGKISAAAAILLSGLWRFSFISDAATTEPASAPTTTTAPVIPQVHWRDQYLPAAEQANKDNTLLLVVYMEDDSPACQAFENLSLKRASVRCFLASFSAVKVDITTTEGRGLFAKTGTAETPLTQVITPKGKLLDNIPGCIIPASALMERLEYSLDYWSAVGEKAPDAVSRWAAVQARLKLSTRAESVPLIDKLLKMPVRKLPAGVTQARLRLAKGKALMFTKPDDADKNLKKALKLGSGDPSAEGEAMLELAHLSEIKENYKQAHDYCRRYIESFPSGASIGEAYYKKAVLEFQSLDDKSAAGKTLEKFIREYPNDPKVVSARQLLKMIDPAREVSSRQERRLEPGAIPTTTTAPASAPASKDAKK